MDTVQEVRDLAPMIERLSQAKVVMLGEATHGTQEFYLWRRLISEWLITKSGFRFIAVEGDWPPCQALNRYIRHGEGNDARTVLDRFRRWPTWMWANTEIARMGEWLRSHQLRHPDLPTGFYGLDVYSLYESMDEVVRLLERVNPFLARRARRLYACFDPFRSGQAGDEKRYARSLFLEPEGCQEESVAVLRELVQGQVERAGEDWLDAQENARIVVNAEKYYRSLVQADEHSWNIRDRHMLETLERLLGFYGPDARAIVWAHNSHIGDYRATPMAGSGLVNLGGLARERWGEAGVKLVGFGTYEGEVIASPAWDGPIEKMSLPEAQPGSLEHRLHQEAIRRGASCLALRLGRQGEKVSGTRWIPHRAVGVVYQPQNESRGNYVQTDFQRRYDEFLFVDRTHALEPLIFEPEHGELEETWPVGL